MTLAAEVRGTFMAVSKLCLLALVGVPPLAANAAPRTASAPIAITHVTVMTRKADRRIPIEP